jgi:hypothetical protein
LKDIQASCNQVYYLVNPPLLKLKLMNAPLIIKIS